MAITKILARKGRLDVGINYVLNGDKTQERVLTAHLNCDPGRECRQMLDTKRAYGKEDGVMYYHIIQSFKPGEITPELALEIAKEFAQEHLAGYETVIGVHVDKEHIHAHLVFNSVNADTGEKYHSNAQSYYQQIRATSDRLCREHGLSIIMEGSSGKAVSYIEWLRQSRGQPTFRSMLEADLRTAIEDANDLGHFFMLMEHMGWEISHGNRLGFRLRGQDRFMCPGRKNPLFTEEGIHVVGLLPELRLRCRRSQNLGSHFCACFDQLPGQPLGERTDIEFCRAVGNSRGDNGIAAAGGQVDKLCPQSILIIPDEKRGQDG